MKTNIAQGMEKAIRRGLIWYSERLISLGHTCSKPTISYIPFNITPYYTKEQRKLLAPTMCAEVRSAINTYMYAEVR